MNLLLFSRTTHYCWEWGQGWKIYWNQNYAAYWNGIEGRIWLNTVTSGVFKWIR